MKTLKAVSKQRHTDLAEARSNHNDKKEEEIKSRWPGGLNYALFLSGLLACEVLGYFIGRDTEDGETSKNIENFLRSEYFQGQAFKKDKYIKILKNLRNNLAHMYGTTDFALDDSAANLVLIPGDLISPEVIQEGKRIKLNGARFVENVIKVLKYKSYCQ